MRDFSVYFVTPSVIHAFRFVNAGQIEFCILALSLSLFLLFSLSEKTGSTKGSEFERFRACFETVSRREEIKLKKNRWLP